MSDPIRWSRVLLQSAVIVASILLALAADAWWDGMQERELERTYIRQLTTNFQAFDEQVSNWLAVEENQLGSAVKFLSFIDSDGASPPLDSIGSWWLQTWDGESTAILSDGLVQEMMASGSLRLIRDDTLRVMLASFVSTVDETQSWLVQIETHFILMLGDPYFQQNIGVWGMWPGSVKEKIGLLTGTRFSIDFERVRHDREFGNLAIRGFIYKNNRRVTIQNLHTAIQDVRAALEAEAGPG